MWTMLLVHYERSFHKGIINAYQKKSMKIISAYDGMEGIAKWRESRPNFILTAFNLPRLSGLALIRIIREDSDSIPIVCLCGWEGYQRKAKRFGANECLRNTAPFDVIVAAIEKLS